MLRPRWQDAKEKHKQLSRAALVELRAAFERYDRDRSGAIDLDELSHVMRLLGARPGECEKTFKLLDADGNGSIDFDEFCAAVGPLYDASVNSLRKAFALFDADASGFIDRAELKVPRPRPPPPSPPLRHPKRAPRSEGCCKRCSAAGRSLR